MEQLIAIAGQFGAVGFVALAAGWYVIQHDKACNDAHKEMQDRHSAERTEQNAVLARMHIEALEVTRSNTTVLTEIATLIRRDRK